MGRGTIISGGEDGLYSIDLDLGTEIISAKVAALEARVTDLTTQKNEQLSDLDDAQAAVNAAAANLDAAITADDTEAIREISRTLTQLASERDVIRQRLSLTNVNLASTQSSITRLQAVETSRQQSAWCATLTENAAGEVATIEIPGEPQAVLIAPMAPTPTATNGRLIARGAQEGHQVYFNAAVLPGWQKFLPQFVSGTITLLDKSNDSCTVSLDAATSSAQDLSVLQQDTLEDVPIEYMTCNAGAFEVDDHVVVDLRDGWDSPKVIGFVDNPRSCSNLFARLSFTKLDIDQSVTPAHNFGVSGTTVTEISDPTAGYGKWISQDGLFVSWAGSDIYWTETVKATIPEGTVVAAAIEDTDLIALTTERILRGKRRLVLYRAPLSDLSTWTKTNGPSIGGIFELNSGEYDYIDAHFASDGTRVVGVAANESAFEEFEIDSAGNSLSSSGPLSTQWAETVATETFGGGGYGIIYGGLSKTSAVTIAIDYLSGTYTKTRLVLDINTPTYGIRKTQDVRIDSGGLGEGSAVTRTHNHRYIMEAESLGTLRVSPGNFLPPINPQPEQSVTQNIAVTATLTSGAKTANLSAVQEITAATVSIAEIAGIDLSRKVAVFNHRTFNFPGDVRDITGTIEYLLPPVDRQVMTVDQTTGLDATVDDELILYGEFGQQTLKTTSRDIQILSPSDQITALTPGRTITTEINSAFTWPYVSGLYQRTGRVSRIDPFGSTLGANIAKSGSLVSALDYGETIYEQFGIRFPENPAVVVQFSDGGSVREIPLPEPTEPDRRDESYLGIGGT